MIDTVTNTAEEVFDQLIEHTLKKNVDKTLSLFDHSELFNFIDDKGKVLNYQQLEDMYNGLFAQLEYVEILESNISCEHLSPQVILCFWTGKERIRIKVADEMDSAWSATVIVKQFQECPKIIHFHLTHC